MLFSWVGAAALGGFLGRNVQAFVSAVISGAAGTYVLTLTEDADVGTDLVVQPGQSVIISGDAGDTMCQLKSGSSAVYQSICTGANTQSTRDGFSQTCEWVASGGPRWRSGGFSVGESGSLVIEWLTIGCDDGRSCDERVQVTHGGVMSITSSILDISVYVMRGGRAIFRQTSFTYKIGSPDIELQAGPDSRDDQGYQLRETVVTVIGCTFMPNPEWQPTESDNSNGRSRWLPHINGGATVIFVDMRVDANMLGGGPCSILGLLAQHSTLKLENVSVVDFGSLTGIVTRGGNQLVISPTRLFDGLNFNLNDL
eukprot:SAG11_NODE_668_length_7841_cov_10.134461_2_plen_312_part_00